MNTFKIVSVVCFGFALPVSLSFAFFYLFRKQFMPYHLSAVGKKWKDVDGKMKRMVLAAVIVIALLLFGGIIGILSS